MAHGHENIYSIDYYSYLSGMRSWNCSYKLILAFFTIIICVVSDSIWVCVTSIIIMGYLTIIKGKVNIFRYISMFAIPLGFIVLGSIAIAIEISRIPIKEYTLNLNWFYIGTSIDDILMTLKVIFKALGAVSAMYMLILSSPANEIISAMKKIKIPKLIIELMNLVYRYIFILMDVQIKMKQAAQSRLGYCDFRTSCRTFGYSASNLLVVSLKKSGEYYDAMVSRGYDGELLLWEEEMRLEMRQVVFGGIYIVIMVGINWL